MMKLKEKIKNFFKNIPKIYNQVELIKLKAIIATDIKNTEAIGKKAKESKDSVNFELFNIRRKALAKDQRKVKLAIAKNNTILQINRLIFKREEIAKEIEFLQIVSKNKDSHKKFFSELKNNKKFVIETIISTLQNKLQKIEDSLKKRNNSFLTNSLLMLETA